MKALWLAVIAGMTNGIVPLHAAPPGNHCALAFAGESQANRGLDSPTPPATSGVPSSLRDAASPHFIETVRGVGYRLRPGDQ